MREGRADEIPLQGSHQLKVRICQLASQEGRQDSWCSKRVIQVKVEVSPRQLRGRPVSPHILRGVVPELAVKGRLGRNTVRYLGLQGIRPPVQANQDMAPAGGVPEGLGKGVRLAAGRPLGEENLSGRNASAHQDGQPPAGAYQMAHPPLGFQGRPRKKVASLGPRSVRASAAAAPP